MDQKKAFISCSFNKEDRKISEFFYNLVKEVGLDPDWAKPPEGGKTVPGKITEKLDRSDIAVGIFTRRSKIQDCDEWTTVPSVIYEMGQAAKARKTICGFIEKGVPREQLGLIHIEAHDIPEFDRKSLASNKRELKKYLNSIFKNDDSFHRNYHYLHYTKDLTIYRNGYGIARHRCGVEAQSDSFRKVAHSFSLGSSAIKGTALPSFECLLNERNVEDRWDQQAFFNFRIVDPVSPSLKKELVNIKCTEQSSEEYKFEIDFGNQVRKGKTINYEWCIGSPGLFPTTKEALEMQAENKGYCESGINQFENVMDFSFVLRFEEPVDFEQLPTVEAFDRGNNIVSVPQEFRLQKSTLYTVFVFKKDLTGIAPCSLVAKWIPKG